MECRFGLQCDALDMFQPPSRRPVIRQPSPSAGECAGRAEAGHKVGDPACRLLDDLLGGGLVVGAPILWIAVLIEVQILPGIVLGKATGFFLCAVSSLEGVCEDDVCAEFGQNHLSFFGSICRQAEGQRHPRGLAKRSIRNACIA